MMITMKILIIFLLFLLIDGFTLIRSKCLKNDNGSNRYRNKVNEYVKKQDGPGILYFNYQYHGYQFS